MQQQPPVFLPSNLAGAQVTRELQYGDASAAQLNNVTADCAQASMKRKVDGSPDLNLSAKKARLVGSAQKGTAFSKGEKGLRHFAMRVCHKVKARGKTTYNEVAEDLVVEYTQQAEEMARAGQRPDQVFDQKNIRRRVYDALNVLMAMNIIAKDKKNIEWVGLPTNSAQESMHLQEEKRVRLERIRKKKAHIRELVLQQITFKNLVERNRALERDATTRPDRTRCLQLPYILVNTRKDAGINIERADDGSEYFFEFSQQFEIHDEIEILKRMQLAYNLDESRCTAANLARAKALIPPPIVPYLVDMAKSAPDTHESGIATNAHHGSSVSIAGDGGDAHATI